MLSLNLLLRTGFSFMEKIKKEAKHSRREVVIGKLDLLHKKRISFPITLSVKQLDAILCDSVQSFC